MNKKSKIANTKTLAYAAVIIVMICSFLVIRHKNQITEARTLPFYNISLDNVEDGTYTGKTYTSFMHVQLEVTVKDHKIQDITVLENEGSQGQKVEPILQNMMEQNKAVVPAIKGEELASMVFISCVDSALKQGVPAIMGTAPSGMN